MKSPNGSHTKRMKPPRNKGWHFSTASCELSNYDYGANRCLLRHIAMRYIAIHQSSLNSPVVWKLPHWYVVCTEIEPETTVVSIYALAKRVNQHRCCTRRQLLPRRWISCEGQQPLYKIPWQIWRRSGVRHVEYEPVPFAFRHTNCLTTCKFRDRNMTKQCHQNT